MSKNIGAVLALLIFIGTIWGVFELSKAVSQSIGPTNEATTEQTSETIAKPTAEPAEPRPEVTMHRARGGGDLTRNSFSIACVEGHAFLYVFASEMSQGGPALSRFPEWDAKC
ncbi:hypothetical protein ACXR2T_08170 [Leucobacter sp. HY1910]